MDPVTRSRHIAGAGTAASAWRADPALAQVPELALAELVPSSARVVLVAPHPDDEILACGGLLQLLSAQSRPFLLIAVTDGDASHPGSRDWPPERLRAARPQETLAALATLGVDAPDVIRLSFPDGGVSAAEADLTGRLASIIEPGDVVITTWRHDGHPDHEASARACASVAEAHGNVLLEAPVWGWHWSAPGDGAMPLDRACKLPLDAHALARKRTALECFCSQLAADTSTGAAPVLAPHAIARLLAPYELYFRTPAPLARQRHFETLYAASDDPWNVRASWYEQRKRALFLASLRKPHYRSVFEPGCGNGEMSAALACRSDRLLACDGSPSALAAARRRVGATQHGCELGIELRSLPADWPHARGFDLIVVSELAYYFDGAALSALFSRACASLDDDGELVLCHYLHDFDDRVSTTAAVQAAAAATPGLKRTMHHLDADFLLETWCRVVREEAA